VLQLTERPTRQKAKKFRRAGSTEKGSEAADLGYVYFSPEEWAAIEAAAQNRSAE